MSKNYTRFFVFLTFVQHNEKWNWVGCMVWTNTIVFIHTCLINVKLTNFDKKNYMTGKGKMLDMLPSSIFYMGFQFLFQKTQ